MNKYMYQNNIGLCIVTFLPEMDWEEEEKTERGGFKSCTVLSSAFQHNRLAEI